jgi:hypothetical protein
MRVWKKFIVFVVVIIALFAMQVYSSDTPNLGISLGDRRVVISVYCVAAMLVAMLFLKSLLRSLIAILKMQFAKFGNVSHKKSIERIVDLILADDFEFPKIFETTEVDGLFSSVKTAIALKRNFCAGYIAERSGMPKINVFAARLNLRDLIVKNELLNAIAVASATIDRYPKFVPVIQKEILNIAELAKVNCAPFSFNPRKFKYGLSRKFIADYELSIGLISIKTEPSFSKKIKIIEEILSAHPDSTIALIALLDLLQTTNDCATYSDKKLLQLIKKSISLNPNRLLAKRLLKFNRTDAFEIAQDFMKDIDGDNVEKLWFLLIVATESGLVAKAKELIAAIVKFDRSNEIYRFYVSNSAVLSTDQEIAKMLKESQ